MLIRLYLWLSSWLPQGMLKHYWQWRQRKGKEVAGRCAERLGVFHVSRPPGTVVWIHGASVGEIASATYLIKEIQRTRPHVFLLITTGTVRSHEFIRPYLGPRCVHQFLPYDLPKIIRAFFQHWRPDHVFWMESDLWPNLLWEMKQRGVPCYFLNGRLSRRSHGFWKEGGKRAQDILKAFQEIHAQTQEDAQLFHDLGVNHATVGVSTKFLSPPLPVDETLWACFKKGFLGKRPWVMAASTHGGEEELVLQAYDQLLKTHETVALVLAPRHPERCPGLVKMLGQGRHPFVTLTDLLEGKIPKTPVSLLLIDRVGVLGTFFSLRPPVFMGGTFVPIGGHNILEPLNHGAIPIVGPFTHGQKALITPLTSCQAMIRVQTPHDLATVWADMLLNPLKTHSLAQKAQEVIQNQRDKCLREFHRLLKKIQ